MLILQKKLGSEQSIKCYQIVTVSRIFSSICVKLLFRTFPELVLRNLLVLHISLFWASQLQSLWDSKIQFAHLVSGFLLIPFIDVSLLQLVKLPRTPNVNDITEKYLDYRRKKDLV